MPHATVAVVHKAYITNTYTRAVRQCARRSKFGLLWQPDRQIAVGQRLPPWRSRRPRLIEISFLLAEWVGGVRAFVNYGSRDHRAAAVTPFASRRLILRGCHADSSRHKRVCRPSRRLRRYPSPHFPMRKPRIQQLPYGLWIIGLGLIGVLGLVFRL